MWPFGVVEADPLVDEAPGLEAVGKVVQIDSTMKKLFCTLALLMAATSMFARADTFEVGGKTIVVPVPQGFVRVTEDMTAVNRLCEQAAAADSANDTLASYILESGVPTAMAGEIPPLERTFILKVNRQLQNLTVGKNDFAEFKKTPGIRIRLMSC